jgi:hypothetical protein
VKFCFQLNNLKRLTSSAWLLTSISPLLMVMFLKICLGKNMWILS